MEITFIGITGRARSGKTSAAQIIENYVKKNHPDWDVVTTSFAWPLKRMVFDLNPIIGTEITEIPGRKYDQQLIEWRLQDVWSNFVFGDDDFLKTNFPEYRRLLQHIGTDVVRKVDPQYWIKTLNADLRQYIKVALKSDENPQGVERLVVLVPDVRFENEARYVLGLDGLFERSLELDGLAHVHTENHLLHVSRPLPRVDNHSSESGVEFLSGSIADARVINSGTYEEFVDNVTAHATRWMEG